MREETMSGLFAELDIASAEDNPWGIPDNTYACVVSKAEAKPTRAGDKVGLNLEYTITEGEYAKRSITEWKEIPKPGDTSARAEAAKSFLKIRLASFDIPESRMNSVKTEDLIGLKVYVTVQTKGEYTNVRRVTTDSAAMEDATGPTNPFA